MQRDHNDDVRELRAHVQQLTLSDEARRRIQARVDDAARVPGSVRAPRRRMPRIAVGAAVAIAAALALVVAFAPEFGDPDHHGRAERFVLPDTAVARELARVGDRAAREDWGPLAPGEYYHVYSSSLPRDAQALEFGGMSSSESWIDTHGSGQSISVIGSNDPSRYPSITPQGSIGISSARPPHPVSYRAMLANAASVDLIQLDRARMVRSVSYARTRSGYRKMRDSKLREPQAVTRAHPPTTADLWGVSMQQINGLPDHGGADMDAAVERMIVSSTRNPMWTDGQIATGAYGITAELLEREAQIQFVAGVLGRAPLPPEARRSLYRWLAAQPGATLQRTATDALGRRGVRITFHDRYDRRLPASDITIRQLVAQSIRAGSKLHPDTPVSEHVGPRNAQRVLSPDYTVHLLPRYERRTWNAEFTIDPASGELYQMRLTGDQRSDQGVPELSRRVGGDVELTHGGGPSGLHMLFNGSQLYISRGRATLDATSTLVCAEHPEVCQL